MATTHEAPMNRDTNKLTLRRQAMERKEEFLSLPRDPTKTRH